MAVNATLCSRWCFGIGREADGRGEPSRDCLGMAGGPGQLLSAPKAAGTPQDLISLDRKAPDTLSWIKCPETR